MNLKKIRKILKDTAYTRTSATEEELRCAKYIRDLCGEMGLSAHLEDFEVPTAVISRAELWCDGESVPCKGYFCAGSHEVEAPFYYLRTGGSAAALAQCRGKIVLVDGYLRHWLYQDLLKNGAVGIISYDGDANYGDQDIDQRELRASVHQGNKLPCVQINAKKAISLIRKGVHQAKIVLEQTESTGHSHNVIADLPGEIEETIVLTAHYDSTALSKGSYDNISGAIGLLGVAEKFRKAPHRYGLRFVWCGSEERGLLGSKAYVRDHEGELEKIVLNVNLDMIGCIMGGFLACCTAEEKLVHFVEYFSAMTGFPLKAEQGVYSSDSTPFADNGIPALSFARIAPRNTATIHNRYDTPAVMRPRQLAEDIEFICAFVGSMANAAHMPVSREIPENMKEKLDYYLARKREK